MAESTVIEEILTRAGLGTFVHKFMSERIDPDIICTMSDADLTRLGITTVGDRIRLRESAKQKKVANSSVFPGFRNLCGKKTGSAVTKKKQTGSWTAHFFCVSSVEQQKTPNCTEKEILHKTGLGLKKVKLLNTLTEEELMTVLQSEEVYPKLKTAGGFELLRTQQNGRNLVPIPAPWTSKELRTHVGPQARIYIRPIQHTLSVEPIIPEEKVPSVKMACEICKLEFPIHELRDHVLKCGLSDLDIELPDPSSYLVNNGQKSSEEGSESGQQYYIISTNSQDQSFLIQDSHEVNSHQIQDSLDGNSHVQDMLEVSTLNLIQDSHDNTLPILPYISNALNSHEFVAVENPDQLENSVKACISFCKENNISNPVEILRKIQKEIVTGRPLDVEEADRPVEGDTNFITVDRNNLLETSMEEINCILAEDLRQTLEVQFYNEQACDLGGPRKEFFRLVLLEIKEKYFDNGLRDLLAADYRTVGIILALSILQNGKLPTFLSPELVEETFKSVEPDSPAVKKLRVGLNVLGMFDLFMSLPELKFLLQPSMHSMTMKRLVTMLGPSFSAEGSNTIQYEKEVYGLFIKYLREIAAGRRGSLTLASILQFVTSSDEEPVLGFRIQPSIQFCEVNDGFLPTASTCVNSLTLPRPSLTTRLPKHEELFNLYDYAFSNVYYGLQ